MIVKKTGKRIFGAELNAQEKKALRIELDRQIAEFDRRNQINVEACILWALHELLGFGPKRLRRFYLGFIRYYSALLDHYEMEDDNAYLALRALKEYGIDVDEWNREVESGERA